MSGAARTGSIPEARTKKDAEQAKSKIKQDVFKVGTARETPVL